MAQRTPKPTSPGRPLQGLKAIQQQTAVAPAVAKRRIERRKLPDRVYDPKKASPAGSPVIMSAVPGFSSTTVQGAANIVELSRALKSDVDEIFKFVYENIDFIPTYGSQKGALGCLIDGVGNSFDQSELLVELLREAGYTASYQLGELEILESDAAAIFGTDTNIWAVSNLLAAGGIPNSTYWNYPNWYIRFTHCWVKVTISGTDYHFDPSLKAYTTVSGMNLATALSYSQSTFMSNATSGATVTSDYVKDINRANIRSDLADFTDNLIDYINTNNPDATMDDVLGGRTINEMTATVRDTAHPDLRSGTTPTTWSTDIPDSYKATLNVYYWDATTPIDETFYSKDIHGKRLTLFFNGSHEAELRLDGTLIATSGAQGVGTWSSVWLEVVHPYGTTFADEGHWQTVWADKPYLIAQAWGNAGTKMKELHQEKLTQAEFDGGSASDEDVAGEAFAAIFHNWNALKSRACDIINRMSTCKTVLHHQTGLVGHYDTVLMDLGGIVWASGALDNDWDNVDTNDTALAMYGIAFESGSVKQVAGVGGVSSTSVIDIANSNGDKIYDASSSNWTGTVEPALTNYSSGDKSNIKSWWIDNSWRVALPEDGAIDQVDWTGLAYYAISPWYGAVGIIGGGLKGTQGEEEQILVEVKKEAKKKLEDWEKLWSFPKPGDPVDAFTGQFTYDNTDLTLGSQSYPYGLNFSRMYLSHSRLQDKGLGLGWSHNHLITASIRSNPFAALASDSPIQGAAGIVAFFVTVDLFTDLTKPLNKFVTVAIANQWFNDQSVENVVDIEIGGQKFSFVKLPDGSYARPLLNTSDLELISGNYKMTTAQGVVYNFNSSGQISTIVYPEGVTVTYTYTSGKLTSISNGMGRTLTLSYTGDRITSLSDGNSRTVAFSYDTAGNLDTVTDPEGEDITYEYDTSNRMIKYFMPANPTSPLVINTYDALHRVKEQKDAANNTWTYYLAGSRAEEVNPEGDSHIWYMNHRGSVLKHIDPYGQEWLTDYDGLNRVISKTSPEGNKTEFEYDANSNVTKATFVPKSGSGLSNIINEFTYNSTWNKVATAKDGRGNTTTYTYDGTKGYLTKVEYPDIGMDTPTVDFTYNTRGQLLTRTDETDIVTEYAYDATNEELDSVTVDKGTGRLNLKTEFTYDGVGNVLTIKDPRLNTTTFEYDDNRRRTKVTAPSPFSYQTKFTYNENGDRTKVERETGDISNPWQTVTTAYEIDGLVTSITNPTSDVTSFTYNNLRKTWKVTDAESRVIEYSYDEGMRVATVKDPSLTIAETRTYTDNGLLESVEDASGNVTAYEYDGFDRLKKTTFEDATYTQRTYDANGNLTQFRTRNADLIDYTYDVLNRVTEKDPDGMATVSYTYDLAGRRTQVSTAVVSGNPASGDFDYSYDTAGRFVGEQYPDGKDVDYELDENGNVTKLTYPDGYYVEYVYDKLNRLTDIKLNGATSSALEFAFDKLSRRTQLTYENGVVTDYTYELDDDMDSLEHTFDSSSVKFTYAFNDVHELTSQSVDDSGFMWHPSAGGTVSYGTASDMNQYPTVGGTSQSYNSNGCLTDDGTFDFSYDTENQLVEADDGSTVSAYIYDPMRRQNQKDVGGTKTRFIYSGVQLVAIYDGSGNFVKRFVYGAGLDEALIELDDMDVPTYIHHDQIGSVIATTDGTGAVLNSHAYSPFGEAGSLSGTTFGFTGQRYDPETGLYYYKNRHYSVETGRFLQPDPTGYADSLNGYQYAFNDPTGFVDPLGLRGYGNNHTGYMGGNYGNNHTGYTGGNYGNHHVGYDNHATFEFGKQVFDRNTFELVYDGNGYTGTGKNATQQRVYQGDNNLDFILEWAEPKNEKEKARYDSIRKRSAERNADLERLKESARTNEKFLTDFIMDRYPTSVADLARHGWHAYNSGDNTVIVPYGDPTKPSIMWGEFDSSPLNEPPPYTPVKFPRDIM